MNLFQQNFIDAMQIVQKSRPDIFRILSFLADKGRIQLRSLVTGYPPAWGMWDDEERIMYLDMNTLRESEDGASTLIHEGTHALDSVEDKLQSEGRVRAEQRATSAAAAFLSQRYPGWMRKPIRDSFDHDANEWLNKLRSGTLDQMIAEKTRRDYADAN